MQATHEHCSESQLDHPQHRLYPFEGGWQLTAAGAHAIANWMSGNGAWWNEQIQEIRDESRRQRSGCLALLAFFAILICLALNLSQYLLSSLCWLLWVSILGIFFSLWAVLLLCVIGALRGASWLYRRVYHIFYPCPFCYEIMPMPLYICANCKKGRDARLWPSRYGIFSHCCSVCRARMPTLDSLGRRTLDRFCPVCQRSLDLNFGQGTPIVFPLIGGVSAGKTCYMLTAIRALKERYERGPEETRCTVQFMGEYAQAMFEQQLMVLDGGGRLEATRIEYAKMAPGAEITPTAFCLKIQTPRRRVPYLVFFYDAPGEVYHTQRDVHQQTYYRYARGALLIIDPCAIPAYRRAHERQIEALRQTLGPSDTPVTMIDNRVESMLELSQGMVKWRHRQRRMAMAVVVTKVDALDLRREIALSAINESQPRQVEEFLRKHGLVNMQEKLKRQFAFLGYFSCSALGRLYDAGNRTPFVSDGVLEPLEWLLIRAGVLEEAR